MRTARVTLAIFAAVLGATAPVLAQNDERQTAGGPAAGVSSALVSTCVDSQRQTLAVMDAANSRLENARQSNSPSDMRAALADLQRALLEARTALGRCTELQQALAVAPAAPSAANMPGHDMTNMARGSAAPGAAATATAPPKTPPGAAQAAQTMVMIQTAFDPSKLSCSPKVDPKAAVKTTYERKTYFFCSAKDRDEFLTNPAMSLSMMPPKQ